MDDLSSLLDVADTLVEENDPDIKAMLDLLESLPLDDLDEQTQDAIHHAMAVTEMALGGSSAYATVARFALFRIARMLEERGPVPAAVAVSQSSQGAPAT